MNMKKEWENQIKRCNETIERYKKNGFYDLIPPIEKIRLEAEEELKKLK